MHGTTESPPYRPPLFLLASAMNKRMNNMLEAAQPAVPAVAEFLTVLQGVMDPQATTEFCPNKLHKETIQMNTLCTLPAIGVGRCAHSRHVTRVMGLRFIICIICAHRA